jgi:hypothetical protein
MPYLSSHLQVKLFGQFSTRTRRRLGVAGPVLAALLAMGAGGGCASAPPPPPPAPAPPRVPPTANVSIEQAWDDAKMVAARGPGRMPVMGVGISMQPVYGDNTLLVISPITYDRLRAGMTVAYRNTQGARVVHRLVEKVDDGWKVMGLNNATVDGELVTRRNLIGVIYASFNYQDADSPSK